LLKFLPFGKKKDLKNSNKGFKMRLFEQKNEACYGASGKKFFPTETFIPKEIGVLLFQKYN